MANSPKNPKSVAIASIKAFTASIDRIIKKPKGSDRRNITKVTIKDRLIQNTN